MPDGDVVSMVATSIAPAPDPTRPAAPVIETPMTQTSATAGKTNVRNPTLQANGLPLTVLKSITFAIALGNDPCAGFSTARIKAHPGVMLVIKPKTITDAGKNQTASLPYIEPGTPQTVYAWCSN